MRRSLACIGMLSLASAAAAQAPDSDAGTAGWRAAEAPALTDHVQLTSETVWSKAGEAYFSPDGEWIVFQAVPMPEGGGEPSPHYAMYVAPLRFDDGGDVTGMGEPIRVSPEGSANTCGWFHPDWPHRIIFGSTLEPFEAEGASGYQRTSSDYKWMFPRTMDVVTRTIPEVYRASLPEGAPEPTVMWGEDAKTPVPMFERDGYDAECAYSPDGRLIVYTHVDPESGDGDIWVYDTRTGEHVELVGEPGYDGGPFFSPDGTRICYRSDRDQNDLLQVFVADIAFDDGGAPTGVEREIAITDDEHVNWAPFWDPTGSFLVFTTSAQSHRNYEVYAVVVPGRDEPAPSVEALARHRVTHAPGFDGMPAFSPDGRWMMWTSQRGAARDGEQRPSSQVWLARVGEAIAPSAAAR